MAARAQTYVHARLDPKTRARTHALSHAHTHALSHAHTHTPLALRACDGCLPAHRYPPHGWQYFIYLGTGPATWLGNPHEGTIFAEVADEASLAVAANVSLVPVGYTPPGQMHLLKRPLSVRVTPWKPPSGTLDVTTTGGDASGNTHGVLRVKGTALDRSAARCDGSCHALPHTELHGGVVKWGTDHKQADAAACCEACRAHRNDATANGRKPCNVWVHCSATQACEKAQKGRAGQCWLKHAPDLWADKSLLVGTSEAWTSGTFDAPPADHPSGAGRRLPTASDCDIALEVQLRRDDGRSEGLLPVRMRLRKAGAPRAAASVRALASTASSVHSAGSRDASVRCPALLVDAQPVPSTFGSAAADDGLGPTQRWAQGVALLRGTIGRVATATNGTLPLPLAATAVESQPVAVMRGSVAWSVAGGDGPAFFIALADMPHLGVSTTVWAVVALEDLPVLDALATNVSAGRRRLPSHLSIRSLR